MFRVNISTPCNFMFGSPSFLPANRSRECTPCKCLKRSVLSTQDLSLLLSKLKPSPLQNGDPPFAVSANQPSSQNTGFFVRLGQMVQEVVQAR
mmetsp:Transcript_13581/g.37580  ORF Transcript_13581/g.37580 Transcript_13581/m.37580 type:complete len:93 (-) Transcript_13581:147-425(-)